MKKFVLLLFLIPAVLFIDYWIMVLVGCLTKACGANNDFFCGHFCFIGLTVLFLSIIIAYIWIYSNKNSSINKAKFSN